MWYEIDLEVLKAKMKMKGLYYPSMLEVMTDGLKAFIWAEWDEQQKRYEFEHFNPGFRMGEWSEEFSVFGVNNHDRTDEITEFRDEGPGIHAGDETRLTSS
jgi:DnaJ-domain-containing protein 1